MRSVAVAVLAAGVLVTGCSSGGAGRAPVARDGLRHTAIDVALSACGMGWSRPVPGRQVFDLRNTTDVAAEVYLTDARTGAVYGEVEGLGPGTERPLRVTLGNGSYAFKCLPDDADAVTGPTVRVTGARAEGGPAALPVTQQDLIPPTLAYQKWVGTRTVELARKTDVLKAAVDRGDLGAARAAWLPAHLVYEEMGAAYGTFGDADGEINGTTAGLAGGVRDAGFTGFHRVEYGLWHGESAGGLRRPADRLDAAVRALRDRWSGERMDPLDTGLRAHEILENTVQFELTGRTDYGSGSNLATARANLEGTRVLLGYLRPLLKGRATGLPGIDTWLGRSARLLDSFRRGGTWTPLDKLSRARREKTDADLGELVERLADVAALTDIRRTS
ncbi:EfeM/EfeO family lipoprotein [Streptomyces sp. J2-1]|uniref:EfeM/EfeO family lipoprotein n=1 Tax=Streptomyces corallincola TaxID=2851888 RepID=UPI001C3836E8|nr:EfeM/EfeO family lipoprotein [Streptomyces corallincola]MBV2354174.1 EfeM/EfeO family lipoprotein [Streptomyces corallincola]